MRKPSRPRVVTVLGILAMLIGLFGIVGGIGLLLNANMILASLDALIAEVIGVLYVAAGIGFLPGRGWAWALGIVVSIVSLIVSVVEHPAVHAYGIPGAIVAVIVVYYLTRPYVRAFFGRDSNAGQVKQ
jgi:hypothetical protein